MSGQIIAIDRNNAGKGGYSMLKGGCATVLIGCLSKKVAFKQKSEEKD